MRTTATSRLMASVAHDVRSSVASIVYSADFLDARGAQMLQETWRETVRDICEASRRLQLTVDGLLDYAELGPAISVPVSLHEVLNRAQGLLRSFYHDDAHRLRVELAPRADWLRGNPVIIEQIFVNLLMTYAERASHASVVRVSTAAAHEGFVQVFVEGDAPTESVDLLEGTDPLAARSIASSAFLDARAATENQGGELRQESTESSLSYTVSLPRSEGPR